MKKLNFRTTKTELLLKKYEEEKLLPNGWCCRIVGYINNDVVLDYGAQSDKGGGSYAEAKIRTLEMDPTMITTDVGMEDFKHRIELLSKRSYPTVTQYSSQSILSIAERYDFFSRLFNYNRLEDVPRSILDLIRDRTGLSPFGGGVRIPCMVYIAGEWTSMDLLIAISGAKESKDDLFFALQVLRSFLADNSKAEVDCMIALDEYRFEDMMARLYPEDAEAWRMLKLVAA